MSGGQRAAGRQLPAQQAALDPLRAQWMEAWPQALAAWGRFTRLHAPALHGAAAQPSGVASFAWFSVGRVEVNIDLPMVRSAGLDEHAVAVLAHEIGHHVLSPGSLLTAGRLAAQARLGLIDQDDVVPLVTNLWSDLLINDRLQTRAGVDMVGVWKTLGPPRPDDAVMRLIMRADEILWSLPAGELAGPGPHDDGVAQVLARLVRAYADDPVGGVGGFAMLLRPLVVRSDDEKAGGSGRSARTGAPRRPGEQRSGTGSGEHGPWCSQHESPGTAVPGLATDPGASRAPVHPALDRRVVGDMGDAARTEAPASPETAPVQVPQSTGNTLTPADYAATLQALGTTTDPRDAAIAWYREHAAQHLVPFPVRRQHLAPEPLLGGHDLWDVGDDLADVDWTATMLASPVVVPGRTTVQRHYETESAGEVALLPVDLDLYLDSSGSMPDPRSVGAPIALAGAILALSALRTGARVQATTWSGANQIAGTDGFTRDADAVLTAIVAHFGGGTSFPVQLLERTHLGDRDPRATRRPCHVAVISDDGITTMFTDGHWKLPDDFDAQTTVAARAVHAAGGGGTLVLNARNVERYAAMAPGYDVYAVTDWDEMITFARDFARSLWGQDA